MGKEGQTLDEPIATIEGWEDGEAYCRTVSQLNRWELQSADRLTFHIGPHNVVLVQDPHSNHLGGYIWLTAIVFCNYLVTLSNRKSRHGWIQLDPTKRWVEIGSGVGLIGIMLRKLGIQDVVITDIEELVPTMEKNVEANGMNVKSLTGRHKHETEDNAVIVEPLLWNDPKAIERVVSVGKIDYILACDCIYSEASAVDLVATMDALASYDTVIICVSEVRNQAAQEKFLAEASIRFTVDLMPAQTWQKPGMLAFGETLNLFRLRKKNVKQKRKGA